MKFDSTTTGRIIHLTKCVDLGLPTSQQVGLMVAGQSLGGIIGFFPIASALDGIGRRYTIMIGDLILFAAGMSPQIMILLSLIFLIHP